MNEQEIEVLPDGLESAYVGEGTLCPKCEEGAIQPGEVCDECGFGTRKDYVKEVARIHRITQEHASALLVKWFHWWPGR